MKKLHWYKQIKQATHPLPVVKTIINVNTGHKALIIFVWTSLIVIITYKALFVTIIQYVWTLGYKL